MTDKKIEGFFEDYRFLSNFYPSEIVYEGITYPSVEHAYQAAKVLDNKIRKIIAKLPKAGNAKRIGGALKIRNGWFDISFKIMKDLIKLKFQIPSLKDKLLSTGTQYLEETNTWGDDFWGVCENKGENHLGRIIMEVREEIK